MHCTIAAPRTKLASTTSSRLNCATAHHRRWHPIRALQLLAGFLLAASLGSIAHAQPIGGTTSLTGTSQLFLRPNPGCNAGFGSTSYATVEFVAATSGTYMFRTTSSTTEGHVDDPFLVVYQSPFNPAAATTNCLGANDDGGGGWESLISLELTAGNIYTAVITTYSPGGAGLITWSAMGEGVLTYVISVKKAVTSAPTATGGTLTVQLSDADAVRWVALPSGAPAPSALQVVAGNDSTGAAGVTSGTAEVEAADTDVAIAIVGLAASSTYDVYVVAFNGGSGSGVRKATLTTSSPPPPPPDTTPEAFMFPPQTGLPPTSERTSTIVVHGIDSPTPISITTGSFSINGGPQVTSGTVIDGDEVTVSQLTSSNLNEANTTTLTIGGVSAVFSVTTGDLIHSSPPTASPDRKKLVSKAASDSRLATTITMTGHWTKASWRADAICTSATVSIS
jgi:hypothetical protein